MGPRTEQSYRVVKLLQTKDSVSLIGDGRCDSPGFCAKYCIQKGTMKVHCTCSWKVWAIQCQIAKFDMHLWLLVLLLLETAALHRSMLGNGKMSFFTQKLTLYSINCLRKMMLQQLMNLHRVSFPTLYALVIYRVTSSFKVYYRRTLLIFSLLFKWITCNTISNDICHKSHCSLLNLILFVTSVIYWACIMC